MPPGIGYPNTSMSGSTQWMQQQQSQPQQSSPFSGLSQPQAGMEIQRQSGMNFPDVQEWLSSQGAGDQFRLSLNPTDNVFRLHERSQAPRPQPQQQNPFASILGLQGLVPQQPQFDMAGLFQLLGLPMPGDITQPPQVPLGNQRPRSLTDLLGGF